MNKVILKLDKICKSYLQASENLKILNEASFEILSGQIVALVGPSGCGKSTLLQIAGLLDQIDSGKIIIDGIDCSLISDQERTKIRNSKIGFVYQAHHLLADFTALENVMMPQIIAKKSQKHARQHALDLLDKVGLSHRVTHLPSQLSGGEQQRVAIARAIANNPQLLLADEPTGNLDPISSAKILELLINMAKEHQLATLIVTHNMELAKLANKQILIKDGKII
jgi:lipoprotein-releasing system ATP-binding protein